MVSEPMATAARDVDPDRWADGRGAGWRVARCGARAAGDASDGAMMLLDAAGCERFAGCDRGWTNSEGACGGARTMDVGALNMACRRWRCGRGELRACRDLSVGSMLR